LGGQIVKAEIITVGTELLLGQIVDTNAAYLSKLLPQFGVDLHYRVTVGDNEARLADALELALSRSDIVFTIGGLGPTKDDLTKETVAKVVGDEMTLHEESAERMRTFFATRGIEMPESNLKQALMPVRGKVLENPLGTAPGAAFEADGKVVIVLPGPPREFIEMVDSQVAPYLRERVGEGAAIIRSRVLRIAKLGESSVAEMVKDYLEGSNPTVAPLASPGEVHLRITAKADTVAEAEAMIDEMDAKLVAILGNNVFGRDSQSLERVVVDALVERGLKLAVAESCTGGLIGNRITDISGSSATLIAGFVTYSNQAKKELLGVDEQLLNEYGAVSEQVARAMAEGARRVTGTDIAISVTGIAGPTGGTAAKPVGLVYMALSAAGKTIAFEHRFSGSRIDIKQRASQAALNMLREHLA
jgi:nicotinamide-nucleotide amidase